MRGILADINAEGILTRLRFIWLSSTWRELWLGLDLSVAHFATLGLAFDAPDPIIWRTCQREQLVLITGNRNDDVPDSLEATIRNENQPDSLPVFTIVNTNRVLQDRLYAETVAERLLEKLIAIDDFRGVGRVGCGAGTGDVPSDHRIRSLARLSSRRSSFSVRSSRPALICRSEARRVTKRSTIEERNAKDKASTLPARASRNS